MIDTSNQPPRHPIQNEEEFIAIDLRPYILAIIKNWKLLFLVPLLTLIGLWVLFNVVLEDAYQSTVVLTLSDDPLLTINDAGEFVSLAPADTQLGLAPVQYHRALALSDEILKDVFATVIESDDSLTIEGLRKNMVLSMSGGQEIVVARESVLENLKNYNSMQLTVDASTPELSSEIVNAWADVYVDYIANDNANTVSEAANNSEEVARIEQKYSEAQADYEAFLLDDTRIEMSREVATLEQLQISLNQSRVLEFEKNRKLLVSNYNDLTRLTNVLEDAESILEQLRETGGDSGDQPGITMAYFLQQVKAYSPSVADAELESFNNIGDYTQEEEDEDLLPRNNIEITNQSPSDSTNELLGLEFPDASRQVKVDDIQSFINVVKDRLSNTQQKIDALERQIQQDGLQTTSSATENNYEQRIRELKLAIEKKDQLEEQVVLERDLAKASFQSLFRTEEKISQQLNLVSEPNLDIASRALPPEEALATNDFRNIVLGAVVSMLLVFVWLIVKTFISTYMVTDES